MTTNTNSRLVYWAGVASVFYFSGLVAQPIYLIGPFVIILSFLYVFSDKVRFPNLFLIGFFAVIVLSVILIVLQGIVGANTGVLWNFSLCLLLYIGVFFLSYKDTAERKIFIIKKIAWLIIIYSLIDGVWRFFHPNMEQAFPGNPYFYRFKDNSLMFEDSNFVGVALAVSYGALKYIKTQFHVRIKLITFFLYLATVMTFSRASVISLLAVEFFVLFWRFNKFNKIIIVGVFVFLISISMHYLMEDGSFRTKFYIIDLFIDGFNKLSIENQMLGVGLGNSLEHIGIGAHSVVVIYGLELGWFGTFLQLLLLLFITFISRGTVWFVYFPYYINGFSLLPIAIPVMFFFSAMITSLSQNKDVYD
ncbi:hypothetical protein MUA04_19260 [Enterobacteriaceae bacterium H11S18]|uniref:hypothetical protein n=1 Tax=Dryocola clanedunensis TaxID=2925396 RepID=UPI0022F039E6|nr:hypothetical protein [Dryocola clanedunensis]MCT4712311.1 hypothetical protein [Dryocola clanedunensis]